MMIPEMRLEPDDQEEAARVCDVCGEYIYPGDPTWTDGETVCCRRHMDIWMGEKLGWLAARQEA